VKTVKQALKNLRLKKKAGVDTDTTYATGFVKACADHNVDPRKVLEVADTLELHL